MPIAVSLAVKTPVHIGHVPRANREHWALIACPMFPIVWSVWWTSTVFQAIAGREKSGRRKRAAANSEFIKTSAANAAAIQARARVATAHHFPAESKICADNVTAMAAPASAATALSIRARCATRVAYAMGAMPTAISAASVSSRQPSLARRARAAMVNPTVAELWMLAANVEEPTCANGEMAIRRLSLRAPPMPSLWMCHLAPNKKAKHTANNTIHELRERKREREGGRV